MRHEKSLPKNLFDTTFIGIDPGMNTGIALIRRDCLFYEVVRTEGETLLFNIKVLTQGITRFLQASNKCFCRTAVIIEIPIFFGNQTSMDSVSSGSLIKLSILTGAIIKTVSEWFPEQIHLVTPSGWKGQLPKKIISSRIYKLLGFKPIDHVADAIGMILNETGLL